MRILRYLHENSFVLCCLVLAGLGVWVAIDLTKAPAPKKDLAAPELVPIPGNPVASTVASADVGESSTLRRVLPNRDATVSTSVLPKIKPGMTRVEVEDLLGSPEADLVQAVTVNEGRATYRTAYLLDESDLPMTIRPIQRRPKIPSPTADPRLLIALEYDASQPGHPLIEVLYPDPLF